MTTDGGEGAVASGAGEACAALAAGNLAAADGRKCVVLARVATDEVEAGRLVRRSADQRVLALAACCTARPATKMPTTVTAIATRSKVACVGGACGFHEDRREIPSRLALST